MAKEIFRGIDREKSHGAIKMENTNIIRYIPKDTQEIIRRNMNICDNPYLYYHNIGKNITNLEIPALSMRLIDHIRNAAKTYKKYEEIELKQKGKMVVGLGEESFYETSITLHYIYGIPYIPASAIKGVVRHWMISKIFNSDEQEAEKDKVFQQIFGVSAGEVKKSGNITFFDAFPVSIDIKFDVMTPHYSQYYNGNELTDTENPIPIKFIVVENGRFMFYISTNHIISDKSPNFKENDILQITKKYLIEALKYNGIGAKTAVGYGRFE